MARNMNLPRHANRRAKVLLLKKKIVLELKIVLKKCQKYKKNHRGQGAWGGRNTVIGESTLVGIEGYDWTGVGLRACGAEGSRTELEPSGDGVV